jgi:hypothetical protein
MNRSYFVGATSVSGVHSFMFKGVLIAFLSLAVAAFGEELQLPSETLVRPTSFFALPSIYSAPGAMTLADDAPFSFYRSFGWVGSTPVNFLPPFQAAAQPGATLAMTRIQEHGLSSRMPEFLPRIDYAGGEVGFFFGKSIDGKVDRQIESGYILGEIITGKTQISVGAYYEHARDDFRR